MVFLLMIAIVLAHELKKSGHKYLQEAGMITLVGMLAGFLLTFISAKEREEFNKISDHFLIIFMMLLLPPIIFESGYNMRKKPFFRNIGTILAYSFLGTFIAIFFSSFAFYWCG